MYRRPVIAAATNVLPEPAKGSTTTSPGRVNASINGIKISSDF
jgi:hypothetical protein